MTTLTIILAFVFVLFCFFFTLFAAKAKADKSEHERQNNLPALHILTARSVINLWGHNTPAAHNAARVLAGLAGWRLADVLKIMCGRYGLTPDELTSIWASRQAEILPLLADDMSDAEVAEVLRPLLYGVDGVDGHRVRTDAEKGGHKDVGLYAPVQGPKE